MFDVGIKCGKWGPTMAAMHGPGGPVMALCLVLLDLLQRKPPAA